MNRRGFLLGAGAAAAAASLPGRAVASILEGAGPVIGSVPATAQASATAQMLRLAEPRLVMARFSHAATILNDVWMARFDIAVSDAPPLTFRRPKPFNPETL